MTTITSSEVKQIYADVGIDLSGPDLQEVTIGCNENGSIFHRGLTAWEWAERWANEEVECSSADAMQAVAEAA